MFSWKDFLNSSYRQGKKWKTPKSSGKSIPLQILFLKLPLVCYFNVETGKMLIKFLKARWGFSPMNLGGCSFISDCCRNISALHESSVWMCNCVCFTKHCIRNRCEQQSREGHSEFGGFGVRQALIWFCGLNSSYCLKIPLESIFWLEFFWKRTEFLCVARFKENRLNG